MENDLTRRTFLGVTGGVIAAGSVQAAAQEASDEAGPIRIVGLCFSFRPGRATTAAMQMVLNAAEEFDSDRIETQLIDLADKRIPGCLAAGVSLEPGERDDFPALEAELSDPRVAGIIVGTPVYFGNMSSLCKAFLERCMAFRKNDFALGGKVGAVLAVGGARDGGQELTVQSVKTALTCQNMIVVGEARPTCHGGATVWNNGDEFTEDETNQSTTRNVGRRVAEVALQLART